jgi:hypothetical protein
MHHLGIKLLDSSLSSVGFSDSDMEILKQRFAEMLPDFLEDWLLKLIDDNSFGLNYGILVNWVI